MSRRVAYRVLVEKTEVRKSPGRSRHRWEDNIAMDLREVGCVGMDWPQDRDRWRALVNAGIKLPVSQNAWKFLTS
jgi:hypothetical protein